jgi:hypothetical protein
MNLRTMARVFGVVFLLVGVLGFVPGITRMHDTLHTGGATSTGGTATAAGGDDDAYPPLRVGGPGHGDLLGLFHVNVLHNIVHVLFGVWGLAAAGSFGGARNYFRGVGVIYAVLAVLGLLPPPFNNTFGLIPIHGHDVWLHAVLALAGLYLGFAAKARDVTEPRADAPVV